MSRSSEWLIFYEFIPWKLVDSHPISLYFL